jgi:hypothetical protein
MKFWLLLWLYSTSSLYSLDFGVWPLRAVIRMRAGQVGALRGRPRYPYNAGSAGVVAWTAHLETHRWLCRVVWGPQ